MMKKKQKIQLSEDLSYIDNLEDLEKKIRHTKSALLLDQEILRAQLKEVPKEAIRYSFGSVVPFFAKTVVAEKAWNAIQTLVSLVLHNPEKRNFKGVFDKSYLQQTLKQIGLYVGLNLVKSFLGKRQKKA